MYLIFQGILRILNKLLSSTDLLLQGNWSLGNSFLSICHKLMQTHNTSLIFKGQQLNSLLHIGVIMCSHTDLCEVLIQISLYHGDIGILYLAM